MTDFDVNLGDNLGDRFLTGLRKGRGVGMDCLENISLKLRKTCHSDLGLLSNSLPLQRRGSLDQVGC